MNYSEQKIIIELEVLLVQQAALTAQTKNVLRRLRNLTVEEKPEVVKWSPEYEKCSDCGTTGNTIHERHFAHGLCQRCYAKHKAREYREKKKIAVPEVKPEPEKPQVDYSEKKDWSNSAVPLNCAYCFMNFEDGEERVETEDDDENRIDYHPDCYKESVDKG